MRTKAWCLAMILAALCAAGCSEISENEDGTQDAKTVLLGPTPVPESLARMSVHRGFTKIPKNSNYDLGARGWAIWGPMVDFQIRNDGPTPLVLGTNPAAVVVSGAHNATLFTVTQPATTIPPGSSTSFSLQFTVLAKGDFEFALSISNHGPLSSDFSFVVSGKGQEQLGYSKAISEERHYWGVYVNGAADGNVEDRHEDLDGANVTTFSPNGRFGACQRNGYARIFATSTGAVVDVLEMPHIYYSEDRRFVWQNGAGGLQYLAILHRDADGFSRRLFTCVVSGIQIPQVTSLREVQFAVPPSYDYELASVSWSSDGARLAFHETRIPWGPNNPGRIYGCLFNGGQPGLAQPLVNVDSEWRSNRYSWANAAAAGDTLVYKTVATGGPIDFVPVTVSNGMLQAGTPVRVSDWAWSWNISPNGNRIAFSQGTMGQPDTYPYVYCFSTPATPAILALVYRPGPYTPRTLGAPSWTPDSRAIVFQGSFNDDSYDLYCQKFTSATGPIELSVGTINLAEGLTGDVRDEFAISPEGQRVLFQTWDAGIPTTNQKVYLATLDAAPQLTEVFDRTISYHHDHFFNSLKFSPRGDYVSWLVQPPVWGANWRLYVAPLSGPRFMSAAAPFEAAGEIFGQGVETYHWLR